LKTSAIVGITFLMLMSGFSSVKAPFVNFFVEDTTPPVITCSARLFTEEEANAMTQEDLREYFSNLNTSN